MDKRLMIVFLTKEAIKNQEKSTDRLWDCIWKAHRDTMTGARSGNIKNYCEKNKNGKNETLKQLREIICSGKELCSEELIKKLQEKDCEIEFAAAQKLVNMTLKYIIILNEFEGENFKYEVCEEKCDCPIDSIILGRLKKINGITHSCWTEMKEEEYKNVQKEIREYLKKEYPSETRGNIWFDFLMWKTN